MHRLRVSSIILQSSDAVTYALDTEVAIPHTNGERWVPGYINIGNITWYKWDKDGRSPTAAPQNIQHANKILQPIIYPNNTVYTRPTPPHEITINNVMIDELMIPGIVVLGIYDLNTNRKMDQPLFAFVDYDRNNTRIDLRLIQSSNIKMYTTGLQHKHIKHVDWKNDTLELAGLVSGEPVVLGYKKVGISGLSVPLRTVYSENSIMVHMPEKSTFNDYDDVDGGYLFYYDAGVVSLEIADPSVKEIVSAMSPIQIRDSSGTLIYNRSSSIHIDETIVYDISGSNLIGDIDCLLPDWIIPFFDSLEQDPVFLPEDPTPLPINTELITTYMPSGVVEPYKVYRQDSSSGWTLASIEDVTCADCELWMSLGDNVGTYGMVINQIINNNTDWDFDEPDLFRPVYLATNGGISVTAPSDPGSVKRIVGWVRSNTIIAFNGQVVGTVL